MKDFKVVSLVPSWTETLIAANCYVVGRTRYCIHPNDKIAGIPVVGGTKKIDLDKLLNLNPDFVIMDKEENTFEIAESLTQKNIKQLVSHVVGFESVITFLKEASLALENTALLGFAQRYEKVLSQKRCFLKSDFLKKIRLAGNTEEVHKNIEYVIWKKPFMVVGQNTFIAENLKLFQIELSRQKKYNNVDESEIKNHYCLFSSEPYPFAKEIENLLANGFTGALIDGEPLSWYGIRNLNFLESFFPK